VSWDWKNSYLLASLLRRVEPGLQSPLSDAIVMAGGVVWVLAGFGSDAAIIDALPEPPGVSDGHSDDPSCPDPKTDCATCAGLGGMCKSGVAIGCACDDGETDCPAEKPRYSTCDGQDGESQHTLPRLVQDPDLTRKMSWWRQ
jgi:hypothetical protein